MKKVGCALVLAIPAILYLATFFSGASRFESAVKEAEKTLAQEERRPNRKPAALAEARRFTEGSADRQRTEDREEIDQLLQAEEDRLARIAAAQAAGAGGNVTCRSLNRLPTHQDESHAWWAVDFECRWPDGGCPTGRPSQSSSRRRTAAGGWSRTPRGARQGRARKSRTCSTGIAKFSPCVSLILSVFTPTMRPS